MSGRFEDPPSGVLITKREKVNKKRDPRVWGTVEKPEWALYVGLYVGSDVRRMSFPLKEAKCWLEEQLRDVTEAIEQGGELHEQR